MMLCIQVFFEKLASYLASLQLEFMSNNLVFSAEFGILILY